MKKWSSDRWLSIVAIIASLGTLFTIVYQTNLIRKQQYASVLPYLEMWNSNPGREGETYLYILMNNGIGPAFIREIKVHCGDSSYVDDPASFTYRVIKQKDSITNFHYSNIKPGRLIPAGERMELVGVTKDTVNSSILRRWFSQTDSIEVEIVYESVYGERWSTRGIANEPKRLN
ncbi:hypothetical protein [Ekhidna sp. To15]|uniref:hypothetical protein n=1 Tax=Ekhidna sp. To15 TaxID=3395267 RepID=UPI003F523A19